AISAELDPLQCLIDLVKRVLFLGKQAESEIAIVSIGAGIGLVHSKGGGFAAFGAGTESILSNAGHGIDHGITQLKELVLLLARERAHFALAIILSEQSLARVGTSVGPFGRNLLRRLRFASFLGGNFFLFGCGHNSKGVRRGERRQKRRLN